jgi:AcrR family transcriptional regulator
VHVLRAVAQHAIMEACRMMSTTNRKPGPRTKPPAIRREELMDAAQRLFLKHGVPSTTIERITVSAQVAKGTFYLHFDSKEDIIDALGERFAQELLARVRTASDGCLDAAWRSRVRTWVKACSSGYLDTIRLHDLLFYGWRTPTREGLVDNVVIDHLRGLLQAGAAAGAWSLDDAGFSAVFLFSGLVSAVDEAVIREERVDRARLTRRLERLFFRTVGWPDR